MLHQVGKLIEADEIALNSLNMLKPDPIEVDVG